MSVRRCVEDCERETYLIVASNHLLVHHVVPHHGLKIVDGTVVHLVGEGVHTVDVVGG